ncbi:hypothetical protein VaNZ11_002804 [Volvox africanus]|uniref:MD-2-related lipid-recognition domain-containing protein n=1 Tax=Volvox africanus TaxID=51714 RepID=A0ABQ5RUD3_9CHLO|nr:hypothetical protein VaNZ11_002804 [Volvox africanus]
MTVKFFHAFHYRLVCLIAVAAASVIGPAAAANPSADKCAQCISDSSGPSRPVEEASRFRFISLPHKPFKTSSMTPSRLNFLNRPSEPRPQLQGNLRGIADQSNATLLEKTTVNSRASSKAIRTRTGSPQGAISNATDANTAAIAGEAAARDKLAAAATARQILGRRAGTPPSVLYRATLVPSMAVMALGNENELQGSRAKPMYGTDDTDVGDVEDAAAVLSMSWEVCGGGPPGAPMLSPDSVTLAPDPPHHGCTLAVYVSGTNPISTSGGRLRVAVLYMGFKVYTHESALCDAMTCPLEEGAAFELQVSQKLPVLVPPGAYQMEITGEDQGCVCFMCVRISFQMALPAIRVWQ